MEQKTIVEPLVREVHKICDRIGSGLEVEVQDDFPFVGFDNRLNFLDSGIIFVEMLAFGTANAEKGRKQDQKNENILSEHSKTKYR